MSYLFSCAPVANLVSKNWKKSRILHLPDSTELCETYYISLWDESQPVCNDKNCKLLHERENRSNSILEILVLLKSAKRTIDIITHKIDRILCNIILHLKTERNVGIRIIVDRNEINCLSYSNLRGAGIRLGFRSLKNKYGGRLQDKVVIDHKKTVVGNWSDHLAGSSREDSMILIRSKSDIAKEITDEFNVLWDFTKIFGFEGENKNTYTTKLINNASRNVLLK